MARERIAVVGSNSFSGSHFVAHALASGADVVGISRSAELPDVFLPYKWTSHGSYRFLECDLNRDLPSIMKVIRDFQPEFVVNFSAQGMVAQSWEKPEDWFMTNTIAMVNFHDELRKCSFLKKFVQASTPEVYGSTSGAVHEDAPYNPSTPYAVSKAACDMMLQAFQKMFNFPVAFTRSANVCGPGQQMFRIIPRTIFCVLTGEKLRLDGGGISVRSFIHIRDVCEATLRIARTAAPGSIYHLSTDRRITIRALVEMICAMLGVDFGKAVEVGPVRPGQDAAYLLDPSKAARELDWTPQISLEQTLQESIAWVRENLEELKKQPQKYVHKK